MNTNEKLADIWIVAGAPGSGKTTVSALLLGGLNPHPALLDKDTMYNDFVSSILAKADRPEGEREGVWYDEHIKKHEYSGMAGTAKEIRSNGCPVLLSGPFTGQIHDVDQWRKWVEQLGGEKVYLVWIQTDKDTLRKRLEERNLERDTNKLNNFDKFIEYMQLDTPPPFEHFVVDNGEDAVSSLEEQVKEIISKK